MGRKSHKRSSGVRHFSRHSHLHKPSSSACEAPPVQLSDGDVKQLQSLFEKSFSYERSPEEWNLPKPASFLQSSSWHIEDFMVLKDNLNAVKNQLSDFAIEDWHQHTSCTHRAGLVVSHVRKNIKPELCTQAWCKFLEILHNLEGLKSLVNDNAVNTVHLCEAPGAFITCFNHSLQSSDLGVEWNWLANTLNPYYEGNTSSEMINDDRFIVNTLDNWCFGKDNTGNIISSQNVDDIVQRTRSWKRVDLVTADGSVDCANEPEKQEEIVAHLHLCEVTTALHLLSRNGCLVLKTFTLLEASSVCLMFLLNCLFEKVKVFKPSTSKPGNSEVYVLCQRFLGVSSELLITLRNTIDHKPSQPLFSRSQIPESFVAQHRECCRVFILSQMQTITENINLYSCTDSNAKLHLESQRFCFIEMFIQRYRLSPVDPSLRIHNERKFFKSSRISRSHKRHTGSYLSRQHNLNLPWKQRFVLYSQMELTLSNIQQLWMPTRNSLSSDADSAFKCVTGKSFSSVSTSAFCDADLLKTYIDFLRNSDALAKLENMTCCNYQPSFDSVLEHIVLNAVRPVTEKSNIEEKPKHEMVVVNFAGVPGYFKDFISSQDKLSVVVIENIDVTPSSTPRTILVERIDDETSEMNHVLSKQPLKDLIAALEILSSGDHIVLSSSPCLTRLSASLLFLMQRLFKQVFVAFSASSSVIYLFGLSHVSPSTALSNHMAECLRILNAQDLHLLSAVDPQHLLSSPFYSSICNMNDIFLKRRLQNLIERNTTEEIAISNLASL